MRTKTLLLATSTFILSTNLMAQATLETSLGLDDKIIDYLAKHFTASYHGEIYGVRRNTESNNSSERNIKDFKIMHNPTLVYKPTDNWQLLTTAEFKFSDQPSEVSGAAYPNAFYRGLLTLTRKNILTEKENGVKLDLGIGRRQFSTGAKQQMDGEYALPSYGNNRAFATLSKSFGKVSSSLFAQYLHNDYKKTTKNTWKHSAELLPTINVQITDNLSYLWNDDIVLNTAKNAELVDSETAITHEMNAAYITYAWSDKISTYYQLKYYHIEGFSRAFQAKDDFWEHYTGVTYAFTQKNSVTFEIGSELAHARDGRDGLSKKAAYPEVALYVDLAI